MKLRYRIVLTIRSAGTITMLSTGQASAYPWNPAGYAKTVAAGTTRRRRARQADEIALVLRAGLDVEASQPHGRSRHEEKSRRPSDLTERLQSPLERQDRGRDTERDHVGQRVELHAERARRAGHPRDPAVEHVEHEGETDEQRRRGQLPAHRVDDARVAAEHVRHREHARQQVDAAAKTLSAVGPRLAAAAASGSCAGANARLQRASCASIQLLSSS